jgi:hypothetical protein
MKPTVWALGLVLCVAGTARAQVRDVTGVVRSAADSTGLGHVRVYVLQTPIWTESDSAGRFLLAGVPRRTLRVWLARLDARPDTVVLAADQDSLVVYLKAAPIAVAPLVVSEMALARRRFETSAQTSTVTLEAREISRTPGILEADVLRAVQLLPGTVAKNDYSIGYNVRGGESDQNLIALDGVPIFNPSHLAGLFSTFDDEAVSRVDFFTGGFPAGYGGRLSSVLDVSLRTGDPFKTDVRGQVSLLASKALVEGPLGNGGATYLVGARRTYADLVVAALTPYELPYYFTDVVGKVTSPLGGGTLSATGYWGRDALRLNLVEGTNGREPLDLAFNWGNALAGLTFRHPLGAGMFEQRASITHFSTTLGLLPNFAQFDNSALLVSAGSDFAVSPLRTHDVHLGLGFEHYAMEYSAKSLSLESSFFRADYHPNIWSAYADDQWHVSDRLLVRPGVRLEYVSGADLLAVAPRASFKFFLTPDRALTGSAGRFYQAIQSIRDQEVPITIYEFWIGADRYTPVARSDHLVLGLEQWFGPNLSLTVEGYRKTFRNLLTPNRAQDLRVPGDEFTPLAGDSWGADVLLRRYAGTVRGWIAYSYTKAVRAGPDGVEYPPAHDRRHTVNVVLEAPGPMGSEMGVRWGYGSPLPYTGFVGEWRHRIYDAVNDQWDGSFTEPISTAINGERYPAYSRLDVGLHWQFKKWGADWRPYLQAVNLYNRRNVFLYFFDYGAVPTTRTGVSQLPFLPTFGLEFTF